MYRIELGGQSGTNIPLLPYEVNDREVNFEIRAMNAKILKAANKVIIRGMIQERGDSINQGKIALKTIILSQR
jgi:hypothetical protein